MAYDLNSHGFCPIDSTRHESCLMELALNPIREWLVTAITSVLPVGVSWQTGHHSSQGSWPGQTVDDSSPGSMHRTFGPYESYPVGEKLLSWYQLDFPMFYDSVVWCLQQQDLIIKFWYVIKNNDHSLHGSAQREGVFHTLNWAFRSVNSFQVEYYPMLTPIKHMCI